MDFNSGGLGDDIQEGKRTIMVIHCFDTAPPHHVMRLKQILSMHTPNPELIDEAIGIIQKNNSIEFAKKKAEELVLEAWKLMEKILPESDAKSQLKELASFLIQRDI